MRNIYILLLFVATMCQSCIDRTYFGLSDEANILSFDIEGQLSNKIDPFIDWRDQGEVNITVPNTYNLARLKVNKATASQLSVFSEDPFVLIDFSKPIILSVKAEDESVVKSWKITVTHAKTSDQIPFSAMDQWTIAKEKNKKEIYYTQNSVKMYGYFPGDGDALSPWQSPAESNAFAMAGINYFTVRPMPSLALSKYARVETIKVTSGAAVLAKAQVVTGALFTGQFLFDMAYAPVTGSNEPRKMVNIGTPFYARPTSVKLKMRYKRGDIMSDGTGAEITPANSAGRPLIDSCDVYFLLQNRADNPAAILRIAAAHLRTSEAIGDFASEDGFTEVTIPFVYGEPTPADLIAKPYAKIGGARGELSFFKFVPNAANKFDITPISEVYAKDPSQTAVDYIAALCSSSAYGDNFMGAVNTAPGSAFRGSVLDVKDIELIY